MRILHVWDQAGVAALMAEYQRRLGHKAIVLKREGFDALRLTRFYGGVFAPKRKAFSKAHHFPTPLRNLLRMILDKHELLKFFLKVVYYARSFDIVHIHSEYKCALFLPFTKKIIEFHGDDMRTNPRKTACSFIGELQHLLDRCFLLLFEHTNCFVVSTADMLKDVPHSRWIPNPVDLEHFSHNSTPPAMAAKEALYIHNWYETGEHAQQWAKREGMDLLVLDRAGNRWIDYEEMPELLSKFRYFIDREEIHSLSKTALEALALGLKVVRWDGKVVQFLPACHKAKNVAALTLEIYEEVMKN